MKAYGMTHAYVALKPCRCIIGASCDDDERVPKIVGDWLRDGFTVQHVEIEKAKQMMNSFGECQHGTGHHAYE